MTLWLLNKDNLKEIGLLLFTPNVSLQLLIFFVPSLYIFLIEDLWILSADAGMNRLQNKETSIKGLM